MYIDSQQVNKRYIGNQEILKSYIGERLVYQTGSILDNNPITDYYFRFDASKLNAVDNTKISVWNDLSSNGFNLVQSDELYQPTYLIAGLNGKPALDFNSSYMEITPFTLGSNINGNTVFVVHSVDIRSSQSYINIGIPSTVATDSLQYFLRISNSANAYNAYINNTAIVVSPLVLTTPTIISTIYDKVNHGIYTNGVINQSVAYTGSISNTHTHLRIGRTLTTSLTEYANGKISEIIYYPRALSPEEHIQVVNYLKTKWSIA